jgi:signal transduction histidine kinase/ABC-type amino acid transport substrate-binding protein
MVLLTISAGHSQDRNITTQSWNDIKARGEGTIAVYWYESKPFVYRDSELNVRGIEYDLMQGFKKYLKESQNVELTIQWIEAKSFAATYAEIRDQKKEGTFGISAFSITRDRKKSVSFSPPYMSDISVLITSMNVPVINSNEEFKTLFSKLTAVTIQETTYEKQLLKIKADTQVNFPISYIPSSSNVLRTIEHMDNAFGFIDLPVYMMIFNNDPSVNVKRQNLFPVKGNGYGIIFPLKSDWDVPVQNYFSDEKFKPALEKIISKYIDVELYHFLESLTIHSNNQVTLLTKEKEIQNKNILEKSETIARETRTKNFLILLISLISVFLILIILLYQKRNEQKIEIEKQRVNIEQKSEQLEKRNKHLLALDEEKSNQVRILAHDLRKPINHIQGLAQVFLLSDTTLDGDQKKIIKQITDSSMRVNRMITGILDIDAIENEHPQVLMGKINVFTLVDQVVKDVEILASKKNITLSFTTNTESCFVNGDPLFLIQVFKNLISNAVNFSANETNVSIILARTNSKVIVRIRDNGPGFAEEDKQKLFKKTLRLSIKPTNGESIATPGLSVVKKYVELMGGRVWCESELGSGSTFGVELNPA